LLLIFLILISLSIPSVQTFVANKITTKVNNEFGTSIHIKRLGLNWKGEVDLREVYIEDHHNDTLIYAKSLQTNILSVANLIEGDLNFGFVDLDLAKFYLKVYKGEDEQNINVFADKFNTDEPKSDKPFKLSIEEIKIVNSKVKIIDENLEKPEIFILSTINIDTRNLNIEGANVSTDIKQLSLKAKRGFEIKNLSSNFSYSLTDLALNNLNLLSKESTIKGDFSLSYDEEKGMSDFVNTVIITATLEDSKIATNDLNSFYNEFGKNRSIEFNGDIKGTLNNFVFNNANVSTKGISLKGDYIFKNLIDAEKEFYIEANKHTITASAYALKRFMPTILGKTLPAVLNELGRIKFKGNTIITTSHFETNSTLNSALGSSKNNIKIDNYTDTARATYLGDVLLTNFNLGKLTGSEDLGTITSDLHIEGEGFTEESVNTKIDGTINSFIYKGYNYQNIIVSGGLEYPVFNGELKIDDPNLNMDFKGLVNVSEETNKFDFEADVEFAELNKLNLVKRDSISIFAGKVIMKMNGKTFDNTYGTISFQQTFYQNQDEDYYFDDFKITSSKKGMTRKIDIDSPDIITGSLSGDFLLKDIPKMFKNGIATIYTGFDTEPIEGNQFIDFDFLIFNRLIEIFIPELQFGDNTRLNGSVHSKGAEFKFNFISPEIIINKTYFSKIDLEVDNQNPIYNTNLTIDSLYTGVYNLKKINIINKPTKDTLNISAVFKGGKKSSDLYNFNFYQTQNNENETLIGIKKSSVLFLDNEWFLNNTNGSKSSIVISNDFKNIQFNPLTLSHNEEKINLEGIIKEGNNKDFTLDFVNVAIGNIVPTIDSLKMEGNLNGHIELLQNNGVFNPASTITIDNILINDVEYGDLSLAIKGDNDLTGYNLNASLTNNNIKSVNVIGSVNVSEKNSNIDLDIDLDEFNLMAVSPFGGEAITDIRGLISGNVKISGKLDAPTAIGKLTLTKSGIKIPYLNVDFNIDDQTTITATKSKIEISNTKITDTKYNTSGELFGAFTHNKFGDWKIDLDILTDTLLVLDTPKDEDALYYGTAFISGNIDVKGPIDELVIDVNATTEEGTVFNIPLSDTETIDDNSFIHFLSPEEKEARIRGEGVINERIKGLSLNFELDINKNALVEIVIDQDSKSALRGRGAGTLLLEINTLGKFNMWGDFVVYEGIYDFRYGKIIRKEIEVERNGTITWDGSPEKAQLNLKAIYKTKANPSALLDDPSMNRKIPVEVIIDLTQEISKPELKFDIKFPEVSSTVRSELEYKLQGSDQRQNQALYLLTTGSFISESAGENALTNTLNDGINALFAQILSDDNAIVNITPYYDMGFDTVDLQTEDELGVQFSSQISNRIVVNGKVGIPVGGISETSVAGDVDVQWLVNEDGSLRINFFNRQSELQFIGEDQTFEQGAGISYSIDFNTFKDLVKKIFGTDIDEVSKEDEENSKEKDSVNFKSDN